VEDKMDVIFDWSWWNERKLFLTVKITRQFKGKLNACSIRKH